MNTRTTVELAEGAASNDPDVGLALAAVGIDLAADSAIARVATRRGTR